MNYFDITIPFEDNAKRYKTLCKQLHPDMPTGNEQAFIDMKAEWDEYNKLVKSKKKAPTDFYTEQCIKTETKDAFNEAEKIFGSIFDTTRTKDIMELKDKFKKFKNQSSAFNFIDLCVTTIKLKNRKK